MSCAVVRDVVSPEDGGRRVTLARAYRRLAHFHWDDLIFTHLTARLPGPAHPFLISPHEMLFDESRASSLVKIDLTQARQVARGAGRDLAWPKESRAVSPLSCAGALIGTACCVSSTASTRRSERESGDIGHAKP